MAALKNDPGRPRDPRHRPSRLFAGDDDRPDAAAGGHLGDESFALLLEDPGRAHATREIASHLAACGTCRREASRQALELAAFAEAPRQRLEDTPAAWEREAEALARAGATSPSGARARLSWLRPAPLLTGLAAAAAVAGFAFLLPFDPFDGTSPPDGPAGPVRSEDEPGAARLLSPAPGAAVETASPVAFEWTGVPDASAYELVVLDPASGGEVILRERTREPRAAIAADRLSALEPGSTYHWFVRIERGAGRTTTTAAGAFSVATEAPAD